MLPRNDPDRIQITFDDHRLVANAGLILPATLALHLGLPQLALFATYRYHGFITDREGETPDRGRYRVFTVGHGE